VILAALPLGNVLLDALSDVLLGFCSGESLLQDCSEICPHRARQVDPFVAVKRSNEIGWTSGNDGSQRRFGESQQCPLSFSPLRLVLGLRQLTGGFVDEAKQNVLEFEGRVVGPMVSEGVLDIVAELGSHGWRSIWGKPLHGFFLEHREPGSA